MSEPAIDTAALPQDGREHRLHPLSWLFVLIAQLKQFILQPGYRLELVLADPIIQEPTAIAFDGNGRMFVVEDRSYMLDLDMTGEGQSWTSNTRLTLDAATTVLDRAEAGKPDHYRYQRC